MVEMQARVELTGPIAEGKAGRILEQHVGKAVEELVELGEERLHAILRPRPTGVFLSVQQARPGHASTGNYRRNVQGRTTGLTGVISDGGVVYGPWLEGVDRRNQTTRFKGYRSFQNTSTFLEKKKVQVLEHHVSRAVDELGRR